MKRRVPYVRQRPKRLLGEPRTLPFTPAEQRLLQVMARGIGTTSAIAAELGLAEGTVKHRLSDIRERLGVPQDAVRGWKYRLMFRLGRGDIDVSDPAGSGSRGGRAPP